MGIMRPYLTVNDKKTQQNYHGTIGNLRIKTKMFKLKIFTVVYSKVI